MADGEIDTAPAERATERAEDTIVLVVCATQRLTDSIDEHSWRTLKRTLPTWSTDNTSGETKDSCRYEASDESSGASDKPKGEKDERPAEEDHQHHRFTPPNTHTRTTWRQTTNPLHHAPRRLHARHPRVSSNQAGRPRIRGAQRRRVRSTIYRSTPSPSPDGGPTHPRGKVKLRETT